MTSDHGKTRERLQAEYERISGELDVLRNRDGSLRDAAPTNSIGFTNHQANEATQYFEQEKDLALARNLEVLQSQITQALERLDKGQYGVCEECGKPINPERLEALPWATTCVECRARLEKERAHR